MNKKILIITYYWPPNGGSGVQRWLKFVKYLPLLGWQPFVFTPENSSFSIRDESFSKDIPPEAEIVKIPIWEPHGLFFKASKALGKKKIQQSDFLGDGKKSLFARISGWVRGNFFIPDARIFWVKPSVKFLTRYLEQNQINIIVTTGPPHSLHLIGLRLKKKNPSLKWIADFRDPWSEWDMLESLSASGLARRIHRNLEKRVLLGADRVITISPWYVGRLELVRQRPVDLITNGFDEADFGQIQRVATTQFTIRHVGNIDELRDPRPVMDQIREICIHFPEFSTQACIEFVGSVNSSFKEYVNKDEVLSSVTRFVDHLPHEELVKLYGSTDLQLLILAHKSLAPGNIPGKVFEYLASGNPILALGSVDGDVAQILKETKAGEVFERSDKNGIQSYLINRFEDWKEGISNADRDVRSFSRRQMTIKLIKILEEMQPS
jgi:hypothetical protein